MSGRLIETSELHSWKEHCSIELIELFNETFLIFEQFLKALTDS